MKVLSDDDGIFGSHLYVDEGKVVQKKAVDIVGYILKVQEELNHILVVVRRLRN